MFCLFLMIFLNFFIFIQDSVGTSGNETSKFEEFDDITKRDAEEFERRQHLGPRGRAVQQPSNVQLH